MFTVMFSGGVIMNGGPVGEKHRNESGIWVAYIMKNDIVEIFKFSLIGYGLKATGLGHNPKSYFL